MNRNEQEILEKIRKKTAEIQPPDSLGPEAVKNGLPASGRRDQRGSIWRFRRQPVW